LISWRPLTVPGFSQVHWGIRFDDWHSRRWRRMTRNYFESGFRQYLKRENELGFVPKLACNGLVVTEQDSLGWLSHEGLDVPFLSVVEGARELPLTLQRDSLESVLPFADELANDTVRSLVAFAILFAPTDRAGGGDLRAHEFPGEHELVFADRGITFL